MCLGTKKIRAISCWKQSQGEDWSDIFKGRGTSSDLEVHTDVSALRTKGGGAQWAEPPASKTKELSSIPETHEVKGENRLLQVV